MKKLTTALLTALLLAEPCRLRRKGAGRHPVRLRQFAHFRALQRGGRVHGRREQHARIQLPCAKNRVGNGGRRRAERRDRRSIRRARAGAEEHDGLPRFAHMHFRHVDKLLERQPALPRGACGDGRRHKHDGDVQLRLFRRQAADERGSAGALRAFNAGLHHGGAPHRGKLL